MPFIGKNPTAGFATIVKDTLTADGSTTQFTLSKQVASTTDIAVFVGNVRQEPTTAYTVNGTTLDFGSGNAPATGLDMYVLHIGGTQETSIVPADGTISSAKIVNNAITSAKLDTNISVSGTLGVTGVLTPSAGIAIGGTGSANTLDDYEEGTFEIKINVNGNDSTTSGTCRYVKIGRMVMCEMQETDTTNPYFSDNGDGSAGAATEPVRISTAAGFGQLPFVPVSTGNGIMSFTRGIRGQDGDASANNTFAWGWQKGSTQLYVGRVTTDGAEYNIWDGNVSSDTNVTLEKESSVSNVVMSSNFVYYTDD